MWGQSANLSLVTEAQIAHATPSTQQHEGWTSETDAITTKSKTLSNTVLHLIAIAHSVGINLTIDDFQSVSDRIPFIADLKPSGKYVMEDVYKIGGIPGSLFFSAFLAPFPGQRPFMSAEDCVPLLGIVSSTLQHLFPLYPKVVCPCLNALSLIRSTYPI